MVQRLKKASIIISIALVALVVGAVIFGVLNALIGKGKWSFGWNDYRYDESGYEVGEGSIPSEKITKIEVDWIDGAVEIVPCKDQFVSVSETAPGDLPESARLRWKIEEDGTLRIKYRKSAWFFGFGENDRDKKLILRVPERFFEQLSELDVTAVSANVSIKAISCSKLDIEMVSGEISLTGTSCQSLELETVSGNMALQLNETLKSADIDSVSGNIEMLFSEEMRFHLDWESVSGNVTHPEEIVADQSGYSYGNAAASERAEIGVETVSGDLILKIYE